MNIYNFRHHSHEINPNIALKKCLIPNNKHFISTTVSILVLYQDSNEGKRAHKEIKYQIRHDNPEEMAQQ